MPQMRLALSTTLKTAASIDLLDEPACHPFSIESAKAEEFFFFWNVQFLVRDLILEQIAPRYYHCAEAS